VSLANDAVLKLNYHQTLFSRREDANEGKAKCWPNGFPKWPFLTQDVFIFFLFHKFASLFSARAFFGGGLPASMHGLLGHSGRQFVKKEVTAAVILVIS
jgi:hypothetical protein